MLLLLVSAAVAGYFYVSHRYHVAQTMELPITEYGNAQYPEDPAH